MQFVAAALAAPAFAEVRDPASQPFVNEVDRFAKSILRGFFQNALATSPDLIVCDYPGGTKLKGCCTPSGKTYVSVARTLPVLVNSPNPEARQALLSVFRSAFNPQHPDFWGYAPAEKATQLSVEAALVAWSLSQMRFDELVAFTPQERTDIQKWLASCTQVPERKTNHAWFTAINQGARLELSREGRQCP